MYSGVLLMIGIIQVSQIDFRSDFQLDFEEQSDDHQYASSLDYFQ